jgi:hypothetical protein
MSRKRIVGCDGEVCEREEIARVKSAKAVSNLLHVTLHRFIRILVE